MLDLLEKILHGILFHCVRSASPTCASHHWKKPRPAGHACFFSRRHVKWTATESESTPTFSLFFFSLHHFIGRLLCAIRLGFLNRPPAAQLLRTLKLSLLPPTNIKINLSFFFFDPDEQSRTNKKFEVLVTATRTKASEHYKKVE